MAESGDQGTLSRHRKRRRPHARETLATLWSEWRVEFVLAALVILAIFLLVERVPLRQAAADGFRRGLQAAGWLVEGILGGLSSFVRHTSLSDMTAYVLLALAFVFVVVRLRWRLTTLPRLNSKECPRCGSELHRIHRRALDRLLGLYVPLRRYHCENGDCRWQGLRMKTGHRE